MTSSADTRRTPQPAASAKTPARRRVAGSRRREPAGAGRPEALRTVTAPVPVEDPSTDRVGHTPTDVTDAATGRTTEVTTKYATRTPEASEADTPAGTSEADASDASDASTPRRRLWPAATAAVLALALLATTLVLSLRPSVSDADRGAAVGSARTTLESLLSYTGTTFDQHVAQVTPQLASPFREQFAKVATADIKPMAVKNGATVQAKVYDVGVMDTTGDGGEGTTVRVMAFVNQATTTKASTTPAIDQNRVIATMRKVGERWLVSDLAAF
ncbi:hypothetical protein [Intrasporangium sp. YIM S08009]|uniref:hypothetical protein n=1 Tax=Intrasporangium zincisolvens TaxID=3080018 RepID=UPI002B058805|nr:hypothetical protein [Intrasporangium sp. YIM S08009]